MNPFLFLLIVIKNKILYQLMPPYKMASKDNLNKEILNKDNLNKNHLTDGYDNRNNFSIKDQYILEEYILNNHKYELLQKLQTTNLSVLDKLYYIEKESTHYNTHLYTYALDIQNLLVGGLQEEFDAFRF